jgi:hypothetical protein
VVALRHGRVESSAPTCELVVDTCNSQATCASVRPFQRTTDHGG